MTVAVYVRVATVEQISSGEGKENTTVKAQ